MIFICVPALTSIKIFKALSMYLFPSTMAASPVSSGPPPQASQLSILKASFIKLIASLNCRKSNYVNRSIPCKIKYLTFLNSRTSPHLQVLHTLWQYLLSMLVKYDKSPDCANCVVTSIIKAWIMYLYKQVAEMIAI